MDKPTTTPEPVLHHVVSELRHLYAHLVNGTYTDPIALADGLLSPQIARLEQLLRK